MEHLRPLAQCGQHALAGALCSVAGNVAGRALMEGTQMAIGPLSAKVDYDYRNLPPAYNVRLAMNYLAEAQNYVQMMHINRDKQAMYESQRLFANDAMYQATCAMDAVRVTLPLKDVQSARRVDEGLSLRTIIVLGVILGVIAGLLR